MILTPARIITGTLQNMTASISQTIQMVPIIESSSLSAVERFQRVVSAVERFHCMYLLVHVHALCKLTRNLCNLGITPFTSDWSHACTLSSGSSQFCLDDMVMSRFSKQLTYGMAEIQVSASIPLQYLFIAQKSVQYII